MLDDALDIASDVFGDEESGSGKTKADPPPTFLRAEPLAEPEVGGATAPQLENALDQAPIDFIHFGRLHGDDGARFVHEALKDTAPEFELAEDALGRGAIFRAALERETLLLHQFATCSQKALKDYESSQGPIGELAGAAMDLLSSDAPADQPPDPAELDVHKEDIANSGGLANQDEIRWIDLHMAGRDLHQHRADYRQYCQDASRYYVKKDGGGGGGGLGGLIPDLPGVTDAVKTVQGIVFKAFDLYLGMFLLNRETFEPVIEDESYALSLRAIRERWRPIYGIWFPEPPPPANDDGDGPPKDENFFEEAMGDAEEAVDDAKSSVDDALDDARGFLGIEDDPPSCRGTAPLTKIFAALRGQPDEDFPAQTSPTAASQHIAAFEEILGFEVPDFIQEIIAELTAANIDLLERVYDAILWTGAGQPITVPVMTKAGREALADKLVALAARFIPGLGILGSDDKLVGVSGFGDVGGKSLSNMASRYLDQGLGDQLAKVAELSSGELAPVLEEARQAAGDDGRAMELLLGRLPYVLTLQFRNTFFPLIDLVLDAVFGAIAGPAASAMSPVKSFLSGAYDRAKGVYDDAMGVYDDVMDAKEKAERVQEKLADGVSAGELLEDPEGFVDDLLSDDPTGGGGEEEEGPPPPFPGSPRVVEGTALRIEPADFDEALAQQAELTIEDAR